ncbi:conserved hypothetical protein [uncultured delta proteobacterium]|uniref:Glycosyl transferase family 11 n=1 Tax=uncultured delta proteobacterium TaxID=34034 RepID=A0A212KH31_9DELT|nr:conserved hypothetical protein [uncultured delta proteobacterium]
MIVLFRKAGNHSNRLFQNLHFEALCHEYNIAYLNPSFSDMAKYYKQPCSTKNTLKSLLLQRERCAKAMGLFAGKDVLSYDGAETAPLLDVVSQYNTAYVCGWGFRNFELTKKYQGLFADRYSLKEVFFQKNALVQTVDALKRDRATLVGVHVRRGDYKGWQNGRYYFSDDVYAKYMRSLREILHAKCGSGCKFVVFSNEATDIKEAGDIIKSSNDWYIDHHVMGKCDFLIGPPSTFTLWASYVGKTKYCHIQGASGEVSLDDFTYCYG